MSNPSLDFSVTDNGGAAFGAITPTTTGYTGSFNDYGALGTTSVSTANGVATPLSAAMSFLKPTFEYTGAGTQTYGRAANGAPVPKNGTYGSFGMEVVANEKGVNTDIGSAHLVSASVVNGADGSVTGHYSLVGSVLGVAGTFQATVFHPAADITETSASAIQIHSGTHDVGTLVFTPS